MIIVTGAAGFIGSCMVSYLNRMGHQDLLLVDQFNRPDRTQNLAGKQFSALIERDQFFSFLNDPTEPIEAVIHLGARTDTTEQNIDIFDRLNLNFSKELFQWCAINKVRLLYASSAATYGDGQLGYKDDHAQMAHLIPLNPYGKSKHQFDIWALKEENTPPQWAGFKFFNVFGPNEYHKGKMASVIFHAFNQIKESGKMKLFRSHKPGIENGHQQRDFIYVKDIVKTLYYFLNHPFENGIYNLGTGQARTFLDLVRSTFKALNLEPKIEFIDTPIEIRAAYQYFTEADMAKLMAIPHQLKFSSLEEGVEDYVEYLKLNKYY